jgi:hypothetical protein
MNLSESITPSTRQVLKYAERLLIGIPLPSSARFPTIHDTTITINHPVFTLGHLSIYPVQLARLSDLDPAACDVPQKYFDLFKIGTPCLDDKSGDVYPPLSEVTERFFSGMEYFLSKVSEIPNEVLTRPLEDAGRRERFGTLGPFIAYILTAHPMTHLGQLSAWRRCFGLPPA